MVAIGNSDAINFIHQEVQVYPWGVHDRINTKKSLVTFIPPVTKKSPDKKLG